jgi:hypothetical protein
MRQGDGGWAIPTRTLGLSFNVMLTARETFEPDRSRPSSHLITGIVVRALAAHPGYRHSADTRAAELLKSRFFRWDLYPNRAAPSYWLVFSYPFWWTDLLSALDSLARIGFRADDPDIARGVAWFLENQDRTGVEYRAQPAQGSPQRSLGGAGHMPDAQRRQRVSARPCHDRSGNAESRSAAAGGTLRDEVVVHTSRITPTARSRRRGPGNTAGKPVQGGWRARRWNRMEEPSDVDDQLGR